MKDQFFADYLERLEDLQHRLHKEVRRDNDGGCEACPTKKSFFCT